MTSVQDSSATDSAATLRAAMVDELRTTGDAIKTGQVAAAVGRVPRHLFAPDEPLEAVYAANKALVIKRDGNGAALSSLSAAHIQAVMLEQAELEPGMRVLEVGSGGYNAALIQEMVGDGGSVTSVDIDQEIVSRARACLDAAGYRNVEVVAADAEAGVPEKAPYDRIIVTAGAWDIPPAWQEQLTNGGRLVVPLRLRGLTRSIAFDRVDEDGDVGLVSRSYRLCGFVPMQGIGTFRERLVPITDEVVLRVDDPSQEFDVEGLRDALATPRLERWSGAAFDLPDELEFFLVTNLAQVAHLHVDETQVQNGRFAPSAARGVPTLVSGGSFAYRTKRPNEKTGGFESGVVAHGPDADRVAEHYVELLRRWASDHRRSGAAHIRYVPKAAGTPAPSVGLVPKRHGAVAVRWP
ncbi:protein-L-isoaspartate carboxylmethyltransferase [Frankia casuarinae]|uniref:Protein-L-isoaspartate O-methyltransferase n=1 Tax=Frankia casuarinae (strain DSM 45818 / CECT 9043 / HFP020203 / CcI3) TaxID=106370 RepID=Q2JBD4_FRACC|nr:MULTISPECIES: methyltransferase, FxLD system [Frankia]ABD11408.1 Protein-L-isoaspartate(D-aspartate) O-methyltransferase [Frankia casuarinae]ETA00318.1 protein-L-isoaspartate carboxylmethyltransferase [Frankia sp. CcI6]EYT90084.1 protein-L-isoaspartate carboxylmethyltransferase [Frankia casuarinae]KDA41275.1 protein-L-isoaspartate carboxylmethyltransferase [Frankia sp. BMG5.23]OHV54391.1 methyltransferase, FxLD system [Frankia sp. CgIS1]